MAMPFQVPPTSFDPSLSRFPTLSSSTPATTPRHHLLAQRRTRQRRPTATMHAMPPLSVMGPGGRARDEVAHELMQCAVGVIRFSLSDTACRRYVRAHPCAIKAAATSAICTLPPLLRRVRSRWRGLPRRPRRSSRSSRCWPREERLELVLVDHAVLVLRRVASRGSGSQSRIHVLHARSPGERRQAAGGGEGGSDGFIFEGRARRGLRAVSR